MKDHTNYRMVSGLEIEHLLGGYLVDTARLREIVFDPEIPLELSQLIWNRLCIRAIRPEGTDSFFLGMELSSLSGFHPRWQDEIGHIMQQCRSLRNLPLVKVKGRSVEGEELTFIGTEVQSEQTLQEQNES